MKTPKEVSDIAKDYNELYVANCQLNSSLKIHRIQIGLAVNFCKEHPESEVAKQVKEILYMVTPL